MPRCSRAARRHLAWVDLPTPSPPSNVINFPARIALDFPALSARRRLSVAVELGGPLGDPAGSQIQERVKSAAHHTGPRDVLGHVERHLVGGLICRGHAQPGDLFALMQRRFQGAIINDLCLEPWIGGLARQPDIDVAVARQWHKHALPAQDPGVADHLARIEQLDLREILEAPFHEPAPLVAALLGGGAAVEHGDETPPVLFGGGDDAIARLLDEAGLKTIDPRHEIEEWVAVDELVFAVEELL